jgi:hypothetical protein
MCPFLQLHLLHLELELYVTPRCLYTYTNVFYRSGPLDTNKPPHAEPTLNPYARIGESQETVEQTAARKEREGIQRSHRVIARTGGNPSPTPSMSSILQKHLGAPPPPPFSTYFNCDICTFPRPFGQIIGRISMCILHATLTSSYDGVGLVPERLT